MAKSNKLAKYFTVRNLTAAFLLCEGSLILLIVTTFRVVAYDVKWIFLGIAFAYVIGLVLVLKSSKPKTKE